MKFKLPDFLIGLGLGLLGYTLVSEFGWSFMIKFLLGLGLIIFGLFKHIQNKSKSN